MDERLPSSSRLYRAEKNGNHIDDRFRWILNESKKELDDNLGIISLNSKRDPTIESTVKLNRIEYPYPYAIHAANTQFWL